MPNPFQDTGCCQTCNDKSQREQHGDDAESTELIHVVVSGYATVSVAASAMIVIALCSAWPANAGVMLLAVACEQGQALSAAVMQH